MLAESHCPDMRVSIIALGLAILAVGVNAKATSENTAEAIGPSRTLNLNAIEQTTSEASAPSEATLLKRLLNIMVRI